MVLLGSCSSTEIAAPGPPQLSGGDPLPQLLVFRAEADGIADNGKDASCSIETYIELAESSLGDTPKQFGTGGGDARRTIAKTATTSVSFWAHTYFADLQFHLGADSLEIHSPESSKVTDSRFWKAFELFAGHRRKGELAAGELARGRWICHPMDTPPTSGEFYDAEGSIAGTWVLSVRN